MTKPKELKYIRFDPTLPYFQLPIDLYKDFCKMVIESDQTFSRKGSKDYCVEKRAGVCPTGLPEIEIQVSSNQNSIKIE